MKVLTWPMWLGAWVVMAMAQFTVAMADENIRDVVLVVDNSGSMKKNDDGKLAPQAVLNFIEQLSPNDRVELLIFDESVKVILPFSVQETLAVEAIETALTKINYRGQWTNSPAAIERAIYDLVHNGRANSQKSILFLTDGLVDTGNKVADQQLSTWARTTLADQAAAEQIRIFGVAFSNQADFSLIQTMAIKTDASYFRVLEAEKLGETFTGILNLMNPPVVPEQPEVEVKQAPWPVKSEPKTTVEPTPPAVPSSSANEISSRAVEETLTPGGSTDINFWYLALAMINLLVIVGIFLIWRRSSRRVAGRVSTGAAEVGVTASGPLSTSPGQESGMSDDAAGMFPASQPAMPVVERVFLTDDTGISGQKEHSLSEGLTIIGRLKGSTKKGERYIVLDDAMISRRHATITYQDSAYWLSDQNSANETYINDKRIKVPTYMKHGDVIRFGRFKFTFNQPSMGIGEETIEFGLLNPQDTLTPFTGNKDPER